MANIIHNYEQIKSSDSEFATLINSEFDNAVDADRKDRKRSYENWRAYFAVDGGQYTTGQIADLNSEERHPEQYNIIGPKVDTLAGALGSEKYDIEYKPHGRPKTALTKAMEISFLADKDLCHYEKQMMNVLRNGLIFNGELKIKMSSKYDPRYNICFEEVPPGFLVRDPYWESDDCTECMKAWEIFHMDARTIADTFEVRGPLLENAIKQQKLFGCDYQEFTDDFNELVTMGMKGHLYRVIEYHWVIKHKVKRLIGRIMGTKRWIPFPISKDSALLEEYMVKNNVDPFTMMPSDYEDKIHHVATVCPDLLPYKLLNNQVSDVQPGGLPYIHFSANRVFGRDKGIVDDILDLQHRINTDEMKLSDLIQTAGGGGKVISRDLFPKKEQARVEQNITNPRAIFWADGDELASGHAIHYLNQNQFNPQIVDQISRMWDVVDRISKVPAAMDAMSESANESGVLFDRKLQVARMGIITLIERVKEFRRNIAEAYYRQWQLSYNDLERDMETADGKLRVTLNKRIFKDGKIYIENRPAMVPRSSVIIHESPANPTKLMQKRALFSDLYDRAVQTNPEQASFFFKEMVKTLDLDDEAMQELQMSNMLQRVRDIKRLKTEIATLDATEKQSVLMSMQSQMAIEQFLQGAQQPMEPEQVPLEEVPQPVRREIPAAETQPENVLVP
jgi:hypothetical protein